MNEKEQAFQDGFAGQAFNGRNWSEWSAGTIMRADEQKKAARGSVDSVPKKTEFAIPKGEGALPYLIGLAVLVAVGAVSVVAGIVAVFVTPVLRITQRLFVGASDSFKGAFFATFQAVTAYLVSVALLVTLLNVLGHHLYPLSGYSRQIYMMLYGVQHGEWPYILQGTVVLLEASVPALVVFALMLRRKYKALFAGMRGFVLALGIGVSAVPVSVVVFSTLIAVFPR